MIQSLGFSLVCRISFVPIPRQPDRKATSELLVALEAIFSAGQLEPFIRNLSFPYYKNFVRGTCIEFNFPITVITGQNGTNKSSIIKTLYGCCQHKSLGDLWFSSATDVIVDPKGSSTRFIYSYYESEHKIVVEVLQNHRRRVRPGKPVDPDYWETSKPSKKDGMAYTKEDIQAITGKTRWEKIEKNCLLVDFRSELSAFDRYFYHLPLKGERYEDKRDFLRARAVHLREVLDTGNDLHKRFGRTGQWNVEREVLSDELVADVNYILGKSYSSLVLLNHNLYGFTGDTVSINLESGTSYTEAFAGSGEFAAIMLTKRLHEVQDKNLLLLDEPEMSLHPSAQKNLINLICAVALRKKLQVVISTHSPFILEDLPKQAIRTLYDTPLGVAVLQDCAPGEAFFYISPTQVNRKHLFFEDRLAAALVERAAKVLKGVAYANQFTYNFLPGGVTAVKGTFIVASSESGDTRTFYCLDGDQRPAIEHRDPETVSPAENRRLGEIIKEQTIGQEINFPMNSDRATLSASQRRYLAFYLNHVHYLPRSIPEEVIVENSNDRRILTLRGGAEGAKNIMKKFAFEIYGKVDGEKISSDEIFEAQKIALAELPQGNPDFEQIVTMLDTILAQPI